jgi:hypothetical protein
MHQADLLDDEYTNMPKLVKQLAVAVLPSIEVDYEEYHRFEYRALPSKYWQETQQ